jgi:hypothetical protein
VTEPMTELDQLKKQLRLARMQRHYLEDGRGYAHGDLSKLTQCHVLAREEAILEKKIAELETK